MFLIKNVKNVNNKILFRHLIRRNKHAIEIRNEKIILSSSNYDLKEAEKKKPELNEFLPAVTKAETLEGKYSALAEKLNEIEKQKEESKDKVEEYIHYPYAKKDNIHQPWEKKDVKESPIVKNILESYEKMNERLMKFLLSRVDPLNEGLMKEVNHFKNAIWRSNYSYPDPTIPISKVPCGGCGALLHCKDVSLPGFMPKDKFKLLNEKQLRNEQCQRCLYLDTMGVALKTNVDPEEYPKLISEIKDKKALVILMIDLLDFPNSIWPGIIDLIGQRPICVVANKVDILPNDNYLEHKKYLARIEIAVKKCLKNCGIDKGNNIKHLALVSAKTGFGIEELISHLQNNWAKKGHVYIVGSTNVGKSSLFNALLQSDYCRSEVTDLIYRAKVSPWPGTTLNLLKFPILHPSEWQLRLRTTRLTNIYRLQNLEYVLRRKSYLETKCPKYATLIGRLGMTFKPKFLPYDCNQEAGLVPVERRDLEVKPSSLDLARGIFAKSFYCYDTPGTIHKSQLIDLLTADEIQKAIPKTMIEPQSFQVNPGQTLFIGGLARIDVVKHINLTGKLKPKKPYKSHGKMIIPELPAQLPPRRIKITVFCSRHLPINVLDTTKADIFYKLALEENLLVVPANISNRLKDFPPLEPEEFEIEGISGYQSGSDIVLSSAGWVSITSYDDWKCTLRVFTPEGKGLELRTPPLLEFAVNLKRPQKHIEIKKGSQYSSITDEKHNRS